MSDDGKLRVVLLLGAGASTIFGCPTIAEFFDQLNKMELVLRENPSDSDQEILKYIDEFWMLRQDCMQAASIGKRFNPDNYEDVLSIANEWREWGSYGNSQYESAIRTIAFALYNPIEFFDKLGKRGALISIQREVQQFLLFAIPLLARDPHGKIDTLTFNVDFMLERELLKRGYVIDYIFTKTKRWQGEELKKAYMDRNIRILKLHGSLNWLKRQRGDTEYMNFMNNEIKQGIEIIDSRHVHWNKSYTPYVIEPTLRKVIKAEGLKKIWKEAHQAISAAHYIVVCGYSFPNTDLHAVSFLRSAISRNPYLRKIYIFDVNFDLLRNNILSHFENSFVERVFRAFLITGDYLQDMERWESTKGVGGLAYAIRKSIYGTYEKGKPGVLKSDLEKPDRSDGMRPDDTLRKLIEIINSLSTNRPFIT